MKTPFRVKATIVISSLWMFSAFYWFGILYRDISQFVFAMGFGLIGLYIAHNEFSKLEMKEERIANLQDSMEAMYIKYEELDKAVDSLDNYFQKKIEEVKK